MATKTLLEAIRDALIEEMRRDERVFVLGEDVGRRGGVFRVTQGLIDEFGPARVLDTPLAESLIVGVAIGAAAYGMRPVAEIQFADFIHPAMDQIINEAAKIRYRSNGAWGCPIVIRAPYGGGVHGALYHSQSVEALFHHVPGLKIVAPATPYDAKGLLKAAIRDPDPVLFFEHKKAYRSIRGEVPEEEYVLPIGKADVKRPGEHLTVITYGYNVHLCLEAAARLSRDEGIEAEVIDLRTLLPIDKETILTSVRKTGRVLISHEDTKTGGIGAEVAAIIAEEALFYLDAPIVRLAPPDVHAMPFNGRLEAAFMPTVEQHYAAMRDLARF
ncbi:MAG: 2-oxoisovalerate dehydrogenase [Firmicutes bacterium ZCTH02-B6]|nr:MAG: 2-oxoisovalerate dehydrogenase [Firmicutes bacterium ZCTH02-B6]